MKTRIDEKFYTEAIKREDAGHAVLALLADWEHNGAETISFSALMSDNGPTLREAIKTWDGLRATAQEGR